ncbi:von Willebrand factor A domain-containing protein 7-like [Thalassophryne amazonica]|uniref:von Willebrand factor A domain-containing protein 7-like n=1 Tax=Thalassophryne amazonica TaxID=390379 RepID=UPI0014721D4A|nr:von Willebrand factor A domain-containing protein 7-like [Thalassophryne amazonica]
MAAALFMVMLLSLAGFTHSFKPLSSEGSKTHRDITRIAVLRKTAEVCRDIAISKGQDFNLVIDDSLTPGMVQRACSPDDSTVKFIFTSVIFQGALLDMYMNNALIDIAFVLSSKHHFDDETFAEGRDLIKAGVTVVKTFVEFDFFDQGRVILAGTFHTLQDFYSHSNWVELNNRAPYEALIKPSIPLTNLAGINTPTCRNCTEGNCDDNILPEIITNNILTSGYFNLLSEEKPSGKCSHGGSGDKTRKKDPVGGINKDTIHADHGKDHDKAAAVAVLATMELLEDIRLAVGVPNFLRLMGVSQSSALCFVIDTTGSMGDDIAEVKRLAAVIIDRRKGTPAEPLSYLLVPFNDPDFGPVTKTTDSDVFKSRVNNLEAYGGGDFPEMAMSGLQLALTAAPPYSEIFLFTDATAKDAYLKNTIKALIETTKSAVTFLLTGFSFRRRRRSDNQNATAHILSRAGSTLYEELAIASGGSVVEVSKADISKATAIVEDITATAVVTVFQVSRNPGKPDNFTFFIDASLINMTAYITETSLTFILRNPEGVTQSSSQSNGPLGSFSKVGNLYRLQINAENQTGLWELTVTSNNPYSIKVTGQSSIDFVFNLVEKHGGAHSDFGPKTGRPLTGGNVSLMITVTDSDTVNLTDVTLVDISGKTEILGSLQVFGSDSFLATFTGVPDGDNVVRLKGTENSTSTPSQFQRQASAQIKMSTISVTTESNSASIEPGSTININFTVSITSNGTVDANATETFTVTANNDQRYPSTSPITLTIAPGNGGQASGIVTLTAPSNAMSGTGVTLTIEVQNSAGSDLNYAVLRFSVNAKVTDFTEPMCEVISVSGNCSVSPSLCGSSQWTFSANFTDGINGTGIQRVSIRQGNGTLNTSMVVGAGGENITVVTYIASCCSPTVELVAVDGVGNVGTCVGQANVTVDTTAAPVDTTAAPVDTTAAPAVTSPTSTVSATTSGGNNLNISHCLWIGVVISLIWK